MAAAGGNFMRKTPQEAYDLIENMTQHHFQWDTELYYTTTIDMSSHYSKTTFASRERVEVLGKKAGYTIQSVQHNPGLGHPNTFYYSDSDESDDDEPYEMIKDQKSIHHLSGRPTPSSDMCKNSGIDSLIKGPSDTFLMGDEDIKLNPPMYVDNLVPIPRVSEKPFDSLDLILKSSKMTITNPLFDLDSEFTLNSDNPILDIHNKESDESETETIMDEVQINSTQSTAQIPPPYEKLNFDLTMPKTILTLPYFCYGIFGSHRVFDILGPRLLFSLSYNFGLVFSKEYIRFVSLNIFLLVDENGVFDPEILIVYVFSRLWRYST
ncbi:hypothetical protein Tco_0672578 [Tanacetum coccineum]